MGFSRGDMAAAIREFLDGTIDAGYWDDILSIRLRDSELEAARAELWDIHDRWPKRGTFCDDEGMRRVRAIAERLEQPR